MGVSDPTFLLSLECDAIGVSHLANTLGPKPQSGLFPSRHSWLPRISPLLGSSVAAVSEFKRLARILLPVPSELVLYTTTSTSPRVCLRAASERTSDFPSRLVFCPYTQLIGANCTSVTFRASTALSNSFTLARHRSRDFRYYPRDSAPFQTPFPG